MNSEDRKQAELTPEQLEHVGGGCETCATHRWACVNPDCKFHCSLAEGPKYEKCPNCGGELVVKDFSPGNYLLNREEFTVGYSLNRENYYPTRMKL